jgi:hypothetical protein
MCQLDPILQRDTELKDQISLASAVFKLNFFSEQICKLKLMSKHNKSNAALNEGFL